MKNRVDKFGRDNSSTTIRRPYFEQLEPRIVLSLTPTGDLDFNGVVNGRDLLIWQRQDQTSEVLSAWQSNYGTEVGIPRLMENLDRGVVATRVSSSTVFVSWRSLVQDETNTHFNLYRSTNGGLLVKLNSSPLSGGTNFSDSTATNSSAEYNYFVKAIVDGIEQEQLGGSYTLSPNTAIGSYYTVPLRNIGDYDLRHVSIGDLDGDGAYDFVIGRRPGSANQAGVGTQLIEAYKSDGTFLWVVYLGANSIDSDPNYEAGSTTIDVGNWDGIQVYDMDGDGKAEVMFRSANGVVFGDGETLTHGIDNVQFMTVVNGLTGVERSRIQIPTEYIVDGPLAAMTGIGYLDGVHPSLIVKMKNRVGGGIFNMIIVAYDFDGTNITQKWKWTRTIEPDGHNIRIVDVDGDGKDEVCDIGLCLNGDGTLRYELRTQGIVHGDRFYIGDFDPGHPGLEGYGVQQDNPSGLAEYYYDAATGQILHKIFYSSGTGDNGRGQIGDVDPTRPGFEFWSYGPGGAYNSYTPNSGQPPVLTEVSTSNPTAAVSLYWDGDFLTETLSTDSAIVDKFNPLTGSNSRLATLWNQGSGATTQDGYPIYFGDLIGDWREEVIYERNDRQALVIFTTQISSSTRLYSLAQNPLYRNNMTLKGYLQSRNVDYYLGAGMVTPPIPNIGIVSSPNTSNATPTVATPAAASPANTMGTTTELSVLGADDGGESNLTYTWWSNGGGGPVAFSTNTSNSAKNTVATFSAAGTYSIYVTIRDASGKSTTSTTTVTVNQILNSLDVTPAGAVILPFGTQQFTATAHDQFGDVMIPQPGFTWSVISGGGSVNSFGRYTAPATSGVATVQAAVGDISNTASVTTSSDTSLKGWWTMDEPSGTTVSDSSGYVNNGIAMNGPSFVAGLSGNALRFDGNNDYVELPTGIVSTAAGSISMWVKTTANVGESAHLFYMSSDTDGNGGGAELEMHLNFSSSERLQFYMMGDNDFTITSPLSYANNAWHHVVATWNANDNAILYVDGIAVASTVHDSGTFTGSAVVRLGRPGANTRYYNGLMDEVRLYNVAISAAQVQTLYENVGGQMGLMSTDLSMTHSNSALDDAFASLVSSLLTDDFPDNTATMVTGESKERPEYQFYWPESRFREATALLAADWPMDSVMSYGSNLTEREELLFAESVEALALKGVLNELL